ncbi:MAG: YbjQ family protein [bacterium]
MLISTTDSIPGREVSEFLGLVRGNTVRARNMGRDILAGFKNLVGGEISEYTKLLADAREEALYRMQQDAARLNADAIVNIRFTTSAVMQGCSEILAYGTAVKLK